MLAWLGGRLTPGMVFSVNEPMSLIKRRKRLSQATFWIPSAHRATSRASLGLCLPHMALGLSTPENAVKSVLPYLDNGRKKFDATLIKHLSFLAHLNKTKKRLKFFQKLYILAFLIKNILGKNTIQFIISATKSLL